MNIPPQVAKPNTARIEEEKILVLVSFHKGNLTKIYIKLTPYLHQKSADWASNIVLFEFVPNSTIFKL